MLLTGSEVGGVERDDTREEGTVGSVFVQS